MCFLSIKECKTILVSKNCLLLKYFTFLLELRGQQVNKLDFSVLSFTNLTI